MIRFGSNIRLLVRRTTYDIRSSNNNLNSDICSSSILLRRVSCNCIRNQTRHIIYKTNSRSCSSIIFSTSTTSPSSIVLNSKDSYTYRQFFFSSSVLQRKSKEERNNCVIQEKKNTFIRSTVRSMSTMSEEETKKEEAEQPVEYFRTDYKPLSHVVSNVELHFDIHAGKTTVTSVLTVQPNDTSKETQEFELDGEQSCLNLQSISLDGKTLTKDVDYTLKNDKLKLMPSLLSSSSAQKVEVVVDIVPEENLQLSGLYKSGTNYCTQCEAMGFRRITFYPDRPDIMAIFDKVTIVTDKKDFPILLSNGNLLEEGDVEGDDSRHFAIWSDPFPKPSYLFALVAGDLGSISDTYTTTSGRKVELNIYSEPQNVHKLDYAMQSLKDSMKWDEDSFGLEYDLDLYNIVAVNDFNMGAMENKGLNVFNTAYVLADQKTASDTDFERVQGVIGHEYFHNWTGNRVTCRDWFQLTLKEGLTVYRDQEFSGDMNSNNVKRIEDVRGLRGRQFAEDAGPMSHPIRPDSYISMDNFYTATVYSKGAEVIRMYRTLLTKEGFRKGMDLYFQRHDGQAVTCDDFRNAMSHANDNFDLTQFAKWYSTSGTPVVSYEYDYNSEDATLTLTLTQSTSTGEPLHIPVSFGLLDKSTGDEVLPTQVLQLKETTQTFTFDNLKGDVIPSILRDFSAPVKLVAKEGTMTSEELEEELTFLAAYDTDGFNKWEAGQKLYTRMIFNEMDEVENDATWKRVLKAFGETLEQVGTEDYSIKAYALTLPSESSLAEDLGSKPVDPVAIHKSRGSVKKALARHFQREIKSQYEELTTMMEKDGEFKVDATSVGRRRLRNILMDYLCSIKESSEELEEASSLAWKHYTDAIGMTDRMAALNALASMDGTDLQSKALKTFYNDAEGDALVLNKWFMVQALADGPDILNKVKELTKHPDFTLSNPNRCRALLSAFTMNAAGFHASDGEGYSFIADMIAKIDELNPQISSRMASSLIAWKKYTPERGAKMKEQLEKLSKSKLSPDLFEIVNRGLK